jgi:hypothetical protein
MPAFMFEKISPPNNRGAVSPVASNHGHRKDPSKKQAGLIVQILHRLAEVRARSSLRGERSVIARQKSKASD